MVLPVNPLMDIYKCFPARPVPHAMQQHFSRGGFLLSLRTSDFAFFCKHPDRFALLTRIGLRAVREAPSGKINERYGLHCVCRIPPQEVFYL